MVQSAFQTNIFGKMWVPSAVQSSSTTARLTAAWAAGPAAPPEIRAREKRVPEPSNVVLFVGFYAKYPNQKPEQAQKQELHWKVQVHFECKRTRAGCLTTAIIQPHSFVVLIQRDTQCIN